LGVRMFRSGNPAGKRAVELRRGAYALTGHPTSDSSRAGLSAPRDDRQTFRDIRREATHVIGRAAAQEGSVFVPRKTECDTTNGQVFWLPDRPTCRTFPPRTCEAVAICGVRPRLQRRDRNGFAPFSLFFTPDAKSKATPTSLAILPPWDGLSTYELDGVLGECFNRLEIRLIREPRVAGGR
jgi:hypothetical protein